MPSSSGESWKLHGIARLRRWSEADARAVIEALEASALPLSQFAARYGLDPLRLYRWRARLRTVSAIEQVTFREVRLPNATAVHAVANPGAGRYEILLRSGRVLRVDAAFDDDALRRLLALLEEEDDRC